MEMQYGKNYRVIGGDEASEWAKDCVGFVITPLEKKDEFLMVEWKVYGNDFPELIEGSEYWFGDFKVVSVPEDKEEFAKSENVTIGNWICFSCLLLEEVE